MSEQLKSIFPGVVLKTVPAFNDDRGTLMEFYRIDEANLVPQMGYISWTKPGIARGPHEHERQTDVFIFLDGEYDLHLWGDADGSGEMSKEVWRGLGKNKPTQVVVPPGVIHAYKNVGESDAFVLNCPDQLYAGWGKKRPVDEIRHEDRGMTLD